MPIGLKLVETLADGECLALKKGVQPDEQGRQPGNMLIHFKQMSPGDCRGLKRDRAERTGRCLYLVMPRLHELQLDL